MRNILYTLLLAILFTACNTNDDTFYNDKNVSIPNLVQVEVPLIPLHVNDYLYVDSFISRLQTEPNQSTLLDLRKSTGNADRFVFSYFLEKKVSATEWAYVNIDKNTIIIDKGDASTGQYVLGNALFNSTNDQYEYRVGIPMLSTGQYRLSFDSDPSNNMIQLRSNSINNNLFLNIDTTASTIDGTGFYYFSVL
ncbi:hypothetical protein OX284_004655 [Flavobacterium sp. SUN046]|uniref:hypothetical protein n=1 Tax=Flavobacterium sp. SUN046 TaxID=3002440 RepID=UPI002DBDC904|nr:hypothetical protein [Flavobacterium sp. SUN046]MEC4048711.1 hypothetical protein [Flavobacterium sp. SUN046]